MIIQDNGIGGIQAKRYRELYFVLHPSIHPLRALFNIWSILNVDIGIERIEQTINDKQRKHNVGYRIWVQKGRYYYREVDKGRFQERS